MDTLMPVSWWSGLLRDEKQLIGKMPEVKCEPREGVRVLSALDSPLDFELQEQLDKVFDADF